VVFCDDAYTFDVHVTTETAEAGLVSAGGRRLS
jgi:hypothetical protein